MSWPYWANVITTSLAMGNALATAIDPDGGANTFGRMRLRPAGSTDTTPSAWAASTPLTESGEAKFVEFDGAGPYPLINADGIDDATIATARQAISTEHGLRSQYEATLDQFIAANGWEIME